MEKIIDQAKEIGLYNGKYRNGKKQPRSIKDHSKEERNQLRCRLKRGKERDQTKIPMEYKFKKKMFWK
jgi:hypothetical protein